MNNILKNTRVQIASLLALTAICAYALWSYIFSFQTVTFTFDQKLGYIELIRDDQKLYPAHNQPVKLKKGRYTIRNIGSSITPTARNLTVDATSQTIHVEFDYTEQHLENLYKLQQVAIETALLTQYPAITQNYRIEHSRLYHHGEVYGASLVATDQSGDNADTLYVVMKKKGDTWQVVSRPPAPILSAPDYPDISRDVLLRINQGK